MDTTEAPQIIEHIHEGVTFTPYETRWVPCSARMVGLGIFPRGTGCLKVYELRQGELKVVKETEKKDVKVEPLAPRRPKTGALRREISWTATNLTCSAWRLRLFCQGARVHHQLHGRLRGTGRGHGAPEIVTGGRDGCGKVWDPRVKDPVSSEPEEVVQRDCWTVCFGNSYNDDERVVCAGYDNGDVKIFDLRTNEMRWETNLSNGVTGLEFDRKDIEMNKLVATTLESKYRVYDMRTQHQEEGFSYLTEKAHKATIWMAKHLPQNRDLFMTCGGNGGLNIYKYSYPSSRPRRTQTASSRACLGVWSCSIPKCFHAACRVFDWSPDKRD